MMSIKRTLIPALLIAVLFLVGVAGAQAEVTATLLGPEEAAKATVGDPLELTLVVTHPTGYQVIAPEFGEQWGDFIIRSQSPAAVADNGDGTTTTIVVLDARLFAPGEFSTPPLPVTLTDGAGQLLEVTAPPTTVTINSVLVEGDTTLRDIKPQATLPYTNLLPWLAGGLFLVLAAALGYWAWQRHQTRLALAAVDNRLPHEIALDELNHAAQLGLPEQGRFKEHYSLVSDTVRRYLERAYDLPMMERTTGEVETVLKRTTMDRGTTRRVIAFLQESDLVKFADLLPSEAEAYDLIAQGRMIVEATKPLVIPPGSEGNGPNTPATAARTYDPAGTYSDNGQDAKIEVSA